MGKWNIKSDFLSKWNHTGGRYGAGAFWGTIAERLGWEIRKVASSNLCHKSNKLN